MRKTSAGDLREKITFQRRAETDDGYGNPISGGWQDQFTVRGRLMPKMGSEAVVASRLQGLQPFILTVRSNHQTRAVTPAWRAVNARTSEVYDIRTAANPDERNAFVEMMVMLGNG
jgi:head-tail adaptor